MVAFAVFHIEVTKMSTSLERLIIVGAGSTARLVMNFVRTHRLFEIAGFAVGSAYKGANEFEGIPLYALEELSARQRAECVFFVALMWNHCNADRRLLFETCTNMGLRLVNVISPLASIDGAAIRGTNCFVGDYAVIQPGAEICSNCYLDSGVFVAHDSRISQHCFLGAHAAIAGMARIGEQTFVGINATVFPGTTVGRKCILGAATAIKRNVPDFSRYSTASDNIVIKTYTEEEVEDKLVSGRNIH